MSVGGEGVVGAAASGAAAGWCAGEPGGFVFWAAGEPACVEEAVQDVVDDAWADVGAVEELVAVELTEVVDEVSEDGFEGLLSCAAV